ncbi:MAG: D-glycero-beta-D-manno-heptose-7-phosphate kinase [Alphaproteobacteria bacterium]|nr:D-glycero-beta-D-manno-heptose-7-phosphate kinase [Alphaproteobacteria bacterium]
MSTLSQRLDTFASRRILCIGDLMLDRYIYGQVERISPEAPIPVLHVQRETATLGGAGNVVRNLAALGSKVEVIGVVGNDEAADSVEHEFAILSGVTAHLLRDSSRPTTQKTRYVAGSQQLLRADREQAKPIAEDIQKQIVEFLRKVVDNADAVILSDYVKGVLTPFVISETIKIAKQAGKLVIVDPKGRDFGRYRGASWLTPNRKELADATGIAIQSIENADKAAHSLIGDFDIGSVLCKLGAEGVCLVRKDNKTEHFQTKAREVFDVSGAGDTVIATLALALTSGFTPSEASELSNIAGSVVVGKIGTAAVTRDEIAKELRHAETQRAEDKLTGWGEIKDIAERWRKEGYKVGFTNGCFDLLHPGHIYLLRQARAACDKLVVGLNTDASVKRLKGETRPVQNETARATVLASLADVDQVVLFSEETPLELIKVIRPDVLVKGADYTIDKVVGAPEVQSWGGKVVLAELVQGQSTTKTIAKMKA